MRKRAQQQLSRCADGGFYGVKLQNDPHGARVFANELHTTRLGLATAPASIIEVGAELIDNTKACDPVGPATRPLRATAPIWFQAPPTLPVSVPSTIFCPRSSCGGWRI
jgi:hypothetical protein